MMKNRSLKRLGNRLFILFAFAMVCVVFAKKSGAGELRTAQMSRVWMADRQVGSIDDDELDQIRRRRRSLSLFGLSFGPFWSSELDSSSMQYGLDLTNHREVSEHGELRIRAGGSFAEDGTVRRGSMSLGGAFFPLRGDFTPVFGAGLGAGSVWGEKIRRGKKTLTGFTLSAFGGLRFFRTSDTQMELVGHYELMLKENEYGRPATWGASLSIVY